MTVNLNFLLSKILFNIVGETKNIFREAKPKRTVQKTTCMKRSNKGNFLVRRKMLTGGNKMLKGRHTANGSGVSIDYKTLKNILRCSVYMINTNRKRIVQALKVSL
jgi:hypothetical protein